MSIDFLRNQIKGCDKIRDYVFVSYSKLDSERVYPLVLRLQELSCNIWIDKELKNSVGKDWQIDALKAIADKHCKAVLFMISDSSLRSAPVFAELAWSQRSQKVHHKHKGAVKIIPINADEKWTPSQKGLSEWMDKVSSNEGRDKESTELRTDDYECLKNVDGIDSKYYEEGLNKLEDKGELAFALFRDVLEPLGGSKITVASIEDIETIKDNIDESCFMAMNSSREIAARPPEEEAPFETQALGSEGESEEDTIASDEAGIEAVTDGVSAEGERKKSFSVTGDITYTLYGKTYTRNQSDMMLHFFAQVLRRHQDKTFTLAEQLGMNCVSYTDYTKPENKTSDMPSYFRICHFFTFPEGRNLCVGTAYGSGDKLKKMATLLEICGEDRSVFHSEQVELPERSISRTSRGNAGLVSYCAYGQSFQTNQTDMLGNIVSMTLQRHPDKLELAAETLLSVDICDYRNVPRNQRSSYFNTFNTYMLNNRAYSVGGGFGLPEKLNQIAKLLALCGEALDVVTVDGYELKLPGKKRKKSGSVDAVNGYDELMDD